MMVKSVALVGVMVGVVVGVVAALPRLVKRNSTPFEYQLPSNASVIVGRINTGFDCTNRQYGYYADQANGCAIFHVCYPYVDAEGNTVTSMYSFFCGEGTIFDQSTLTCNFPENALPCDAAESYYNINSYFARENTQFRDGSVDNIF
ncbi:U-scoloptoxin(01)-Cw1a-like 35 [Homarus americanus]|uniref:U-scoloptoxin(01)-Cw1a-like 35 n=2 Tax=Homarus americanus TaxID=6706 RepID=A0A8J5JER4_HOMAM|nr:U-scoloptoxin(01)-Cw1a-like 35 [Homarus americanus]